MTASISGQDDHALADAASVMRESVSPRWSQWPR